MCVCVGGGGGVISGGIKLARICFYRIRPASRVPCVLGCVYQFRSGGVPCVLSRSLSCLWQCGREHALVELRAVAY